MSPMARAFPCVPPPCHKMETEVTMLLGFLMKQNGLPFIIGLGNHHVLGESNNMIGIVGQRLSSIVPPDHYWLIGTQCLVIHHKQNRRACGSCLIIWDGSLIYIFIFINFHFEVMSTG